MCAQKYYMKQKNIDWCCNREKSLSVRIDLHAKMDKRRRNAASGTPTAFASGVTSVIVTYYTFSQFLRLFSLNFTRKFSKIKIEKISRIASPHVQNQDCLYCFVIFLYINVRFVSIEYNSRFICTSWHMFSGSRNLILRFGNHFEWENVHRGWMVFMYGGQWALYLIQIFICKSVTKFTIDSEWKTEKSFFL